MDLYPKSESSKFQEPINLIPQQRTEGSSVQQRWGRNISKIGLAVTCALPVADIATSDVISARAYDYANTEMQAPFDSKLAKHLAVDGLIALGVTAQCIGVTMALKKSKKLNNAFGDFDEYNESRQDEMNGPRKLLSNVLNSPFAALGAIGGAMENAGKKVESSNSKVGRRIGHLLIDTGKVNAMGPPMTIMSESLNGENPSKRRIFFLSALFGTTWSGTAEGIKQFYRHVPFAQEPMGFVGRALEKATTMDLLHPLQTPVGTSAIGGVALLFAVNGWKIANFSEKKQLETDTTSESSNSVQHQQADPAI